MGSGYHLENCQSCFLFLAQPKDCASVNGNVKSITLQVVQVSFLPVGRGRICTGLYIQASCLKGSPVILAHYLMLSLAVFGH